MARTDEFKNLAEELALQIAATNPLAVTADQIDPAIIEKEREIARNKALNDGKKPEIVEMIVEGTIKKYCADHSLLDQELMSESGRTVRDMITEAIGRTGENIQVARFVRFALGGE